MTDSFRTWEITPGTKTQTSEEEVWLKENIQWGLFLQMPCKFSSSKVLQISFLPLAPWTEWVRGPLKGKSGLKPQSLPATSSQAQEGGWQSVRRQHTEELCFFLQKWSIRHPLPTLWLKLAYHLDPLLFIVPEWFVKNLTYSWLKWQGCSSFNSPFLTPEVFEEKARYQFTIPAKTQTIYIQASP